VIWPFPWRFFFLAHCFTSISAGADETDNRLSSDFFRLAVALKIYAKQLDIFFPEVVFSLLSRPGFLPS